MDTRTAKPDVAAMIEDIKRFMPDVYNQIKAKAQEIGNEAYTLVRRGLRGEPNCFYAFERGRVMGTPFNVPGTMNDVANAVVMFGCTHVCIWPLASEPTKGGR